MVSSYTHADTKSADRVSVDEAWSPPALPCERPINFIGSLRFYYALGRAWEAGKGFPKCWRGVEVKRGEYILVAEGNVMNLGAQKK